MVVETIKGKLPIKYGFSAFAKFADATGRSMDDSLNLELTDMSLYDLITFMYIGFLYGARAEGVKCKIKDPDEVGDMIEEDNELVTRFMEALAEMTPQVEGDSKKK